MLLSQSVSEIRSVATLNFDSGLLKLISINDLWQSLPSDGDTYCTQPVIMSLRLSLPVQSVDRRRTGEVATRGSQYYLSTGTPKS